MSFKLSYPEIETRPSTRISDLGRTFLRHNPPATLVDLLEIGPGTRRDVSWKEGLNHDSLLDHLRGPGAKNPRTPSLRVFFLGIIKPGSSGADVLKHLRVTQCARLHPQTADWLRDRFSVSPIFLDCITFGHLILKTGSVCFPRHDHSGKVVAIDGFYRYSFGFGSGPAHIWFSHDLTKNSSVYIADNCPTEAKQSILDCALGKNPETLLRPCAIDAFIAEQCAHVWGEQLMMPRNKLEQMRIASQNLLPGRTAKAVEELHELSQELHIIYEDMTDLEERLQYLLHDVHNKYFAYTQAQQPSESVADSLQFLVSRSKIWKRWAMNYRARAEIRINLLYNLAAQNDSRTNLDIASFTSKIAVETQRDSSAMITISVVTMFFLPGTFVSAVFSMVFFNAVTDSNGRTTFTVAPQLWYVAAITVPLTIIVFLVWIVWQRQRNKAKGVGNSDDGAVWSSKE